MLDTPVFWDPAAWRFELHFGVLGIVFGTSIKEGLVKREADVPASNFSASDVAMGI